MINSDDIGKRYAKQDVYDAKDEAVYQAKRGGLSLATRQVTGFIGTAIEGTAEVFGTMLASTVGTVLQTIIGPVLARDLGAVVGTVGGGIAGVAGVGLAAAVSAGFAELDYQHQKSNIRNLYKNELGAQLGKPADKVSLNDMHKVAGSNRIIEEEIARARKQRNFNVPLAIVATLAAFAAVIWALPAVAAALSLPAVTGIGGFLVKAAVSMATYYAVKTPLLALGNKTFDLMKDTVNDRIVDIKRAHGKGVEITPQQVLGVFTQANAKLDDLIVQEYGKPYNELGPEEQKRAFEYVKDLVPVERLARDINDSKVKATELAFAATGEISGVPRRVYCLDDPHHEIARDVSQHFQERIGRKPAVSHTERLAAQPEPDPSQRA